LPCEAAHLPRAAPQFERPRARWHRGGIALQDVLVAGPAHAQRCYLYQGGKDCGHTDVMHAFDFERFRAVAPPAAPLQLDAAGGTTPLQRVGQLCDAAAALSAVPIVELDGFAASSAHPIDADALPDRQGGGASVLDDRSTRAALKKRCGGLRSFENARRDCPNYRLDAQAVARATRIDGTRNRSGAVHCFSPKYYEIRE
jgi:hypothetical protein